MDMTQLYGLFLQLNEKTKWDDSYLRWCEVHCQISSSLQRTKVESNPQNVFHFCLFICDTRPYRHQLKQVRILISMRTILEFHTVKKSS